MFIFKLHTFEDGTVHNQRVDGYSLTSASWRISGGTSGSAFTGIPPVSVSCACFCIPTMLVLWMHPILAANTPLAPLIFKFPQLLASDFLFSSTRFSTSCFLSSCSPACSSVLLSDSSHLCSSPLTAYPASKPQITFHPLTSLLTTALSPSVTKNLPFNPHPLTLPLRPLLSDYLHSENIQAYTHRLSLPSRPPPPFPLANNSFSPAYRPSNVLCSTLTDPPVFPVSLSLPPLLCGRRGQLFWLVDVKPFPYALALLQLLSRSSSSWESD